MVWIGILSVLLLSVASVCSSANVTSTNATPIESIPCDARSPLSKDSALAAVDEYNSKSTEPTLRKLQKVLRVCSKKGEFYELDITMVKTDCKKPTTTRPDWCRMVSSNVKICSNVMVQHQGPKTVVKSLGSCRGS